MLKTFDALMGKWRQQIQREKSQQRQPQIHLVGTGSVAAKAEADTAIAGVVEFELQTAPDQPGHRHHESDQHEQADQRVEFERELIAEQQHDSDDATLENRHRVAVIFKAGAGDRSVVIKITQPSYLGPGGINPQRDDRQQQVDDPDTEVFGPAPTERKCLHGSRGRLYRWRGKIRAGREVGLAGLVECVAHVFPISLFLKLIDPSECAKESLAASKKSSASGYIFRDGAGSSATIFSPKKCNSTCIASDRRIDFE